MDVGGCRGRERRERSGGGERKSGGQSEANQIMQDRSPWGVGPRPLCYIGSKVSRRGSRLLGRALLIPSAATTGRLSASNLAGHVTNTGASGRGVITADNKAQPLIGSLFFLGLERETGRMFRGRWEGCAAFFFVGVYFRSRETEGQSCRGDRCVESISFRGRIFWMKEVLFWLMRGK